MNYSIVFIALGPAFLYLIYSTIELILKFNTGGSTKMISKADLISMEQDLETGFGHSIKNNKDYIKTIIDLILKSTFSF